MDDENRPDAWVFAIITAVFIFAPASWMLKIAIVFVILLIAGKLFKDE